MQPLQNCIGPTIRIGREILCLPYAGFFKTIQNRLHFKYYFHKYQAFLNILTQKDYVLSVAVH